MVPLISNIGYGLLGACQLPRFWWKVTLRKAGLLDAEYPDCSGGLDTSILEILELDKEATLSTCETICRTISNLRHGFSSKRAGRLTNQRWQIGTNNSDPEITVQQRSKNV